MRPRVVAAGAILALWAGGLATLARRQFAGGEAARLARAALFVSPGADYYQVFDSARQIGYASSTIDTTQTRVRLSDVVVADVNGGARLAARLQVTLTRALRLTSFCYELGADAGPYKACGAVMHDTVLSLTISSKNARPVKRRIRLSAPLFLPTMVPMIIALGGERYPERAAAISGLLVGLAVVGGIVYPPAMGFISVSFGLAIAMLGTAALSVACLLAMLLVDAPPRPGAGVVEGRQLG